MIDPKEKEVEIEQTEQDSGECSKDSDCEKGKVCVRGRCVDDIGSES